MATEDYEQELAADLWRRLPTHNPERASLPTFIDRLVRNRVADFFAAARSAKRRHERELLAFDDSTRLSRDPKHLDSIVDVAGYAAVLREVGR